MSTNDQQIKKYKTRLTTVRGMLGQLKDRLSKHVAAEIAPDAIVHAAMSQCERNPMLLECSDQSLWQALLHAQSMGLVPNGRHGHLIPYNDRKRGMIVQFQPDYKGLVHLAYQSSHVEVVEGGVVREEDEFEFERGTNSFIRHVINIKVKDRGPIVAAWALVKFANGRDTFEILTRADLDKRKNESQSATGRYPEYSPWTKWEDEMSKKSALKVLVKTVPLGPDVDVAVAHDDAMEIGKASPVALVEGTDFDPGVIDADFRIAEPEEGSRSADVAEKAQKKRKKATKKASSKKQDPPAQKTDAAENTADSESHEPDESAAKTDKEIVMELAEDMNACKDPEELEFVFSKIEAKRNSGTISAKGFEFLKTSKKAKADELKKG